jgi:hypothetical protein
MIGPSADDDRSRANSRVAPVHQTQEEPGTLDGYESASALLARDAVLIRDPVVLLSALRRIADDVARLERVTSGLAVEVAALRGGRR